ncbi:2195_t:CDS:2 [Racocetra persica]|uniref:2195_t:CDS:1 n=1 Tax=Racocetra persica TaxID=160502 RepID=A0ACA9M3X6_9GLOM|nr:2195_t:CDS:2 [Racocetra persica]
MRGGEHYQLKVDQFKIDKHSGLQFFHYTSKNNQCELQKADPEFYLQPSFDWIESGNWYKKNHVGKNKLMNFMREIGRITQIDIPIELLTNHFGRKTAAQCLQDNDVPEQAIIQLTGHKSVQEIHATSRPCNYATIACINCRKKHKKCSGTVTCSNCAKHDLKCIFINSGQKRGPKPKSKMCTNPHNPYVRDHRRGMQFSTDYMQAHSHAQKIYITSSYNLNQEFRTLQPNSYDAITQETIFSPQADLNSDYTAAINKNQDTTHINLIDNLPLLSHDNFLFPKDNRVIESSLSTSYLNSLSDTSELSNLSSRQVLFDPLNSDNYYVHDQYNVMQLSLDSTQDNSSTQNINITSSEYFNNLNQNQLRTSRPNSYNAIIQEIIFSSRTPMSNQDRTPINFIDNTQHLLHNKELSNSSNSQFSFDP